MTYEEKVKFYMRHPGYEVLAGEPIEMTHEIIRRMAKPDKPPGKPDKPDKPVTPEPSPVVWLPTLPWVKP